MICTCIFENKGMDAYILKHEVLRLSFDRLHNLYVPRRVICHHGPKLFLITITCIYNHPANSNDCKMTIFGRKCLIFSYFCSKHKLWVHIRTVVLRRY